MRVETNALAYAAVNKFSKFVGAALLTALLGVPASIFSQTVVTATVPVIVNVDATVTITPPEGLQGASGDSKAVSANTVTVLNIVLEDANTSMSHTAQTRGFSAPVTVSYNHGNVSLLLPAQAYKNAEIKLFTVNGRQVLSGRGNASQTGLKMSRPNIAPGVYLLSVKGTNGNSYQTKLNHRGGHLNINAAFGDGNAATPILARMSAQADGGAWAITAETRVSGYCDTSYTFIPVAGVNEEQTITLSADGGDSFTDSRDDKIYRTVVIGGKTWMAENLNFATSSGSWCYNNSPDSCAKYGRLYDWATAMNIATSFNDSMWSGDATNHQGICPSGWRLPTRQDWQALFTAVGGASVAGTALKSSPSDTPPWDGGTNSHGFSALPGGGGWYGSFGGLGDWGNWWSATEGVANFAWYVGMTSGRTDVHELWNDKYYGFSVRCLRD